MPSPTYFDFDTTNLEDYDPERVATALREHPAIYLNHLELAQHLTNWADRLDVDIPKKDEDGIAYTDALREVAAHLRQADYIPGGDQLEGGV
ncbi:hypothetical protein [Rhodococcus sp. JG-3]|uniref:hypothetical protein n=1 Tax=Rhodococcus sp. JG-3 TaxID=1305835 RepID=UPI00040AAAA0|nr:hypothetical protein [Rhodococcus sp. JG-3]